MDYRDWAALVERAAGGDVQAARDVLEEFANSVDELTVLRNPEREWPRPVPMQVVKYMRDACRLILTGTDPARAFNLVGPTRGRRKGEKVTHDATALAAAYSLLARHGLKPEEANRALDEQLGVDRATIYRARSKNQAFEAWVRKDDGAIRALIDEASLKAMAARFSKQLAEILESRRTKS